MLVRQYRVHYAGPIALTMAGSFQHPFQCLQFIEKQQRLLIASAGSKIFSYAAETGKRLDVWPRNVGPKIESSTESHAPHEKKRKVSPPENGPAEVTKSPEEETESQTSSTWSTIPILTISSGGEYVVALTGEDKTIRVLKVAEDGTLRQLSARSVAQAPLPTGMLMLDAGVCQSGRVPLL